ncbi:23084_t:CDS:2, partial [Cetraspora pellucida]
MLNNYTLRKVRKEAEIIRSFFSLEEEFELLKKLVILLSFFDKATEFLSRFKYPTLGFMILMLEELAYQIKNFTSLKNKIILVKDRILENLIEQDLHYTIIQLMHCKYDKLHLTQIANDNTTPTNNEDTILVLYENKKTKISAFFSYSQTENTMPDKFDRYCKISEISLNEELCLL